MDRIWSSNEAEEVLLIGRNPSPLQEGVTACPIRSRVQSPGHSAGPAYPIVLSQATHPKEISAGWAGIALNSDILVLANLCTI